MKFSDIKDRLHQEAIRQSNIELSSGIDTANLLYEAESEIAKLQEFVGEYVSNDLARQAANDALIAAAKAREAALNTRIKQLERLIYLYVDACAMPEEDVTAVLKIIEDFNNV